MSYTFKGRLCGYLCEECQEPLARVRVRLYRARDENLTARAVASAKETYAILGDQDLEQRGLPIAEADTDDQGRFAIELDEERYDGGPFDVDLYFETVPRPRVATGVRPLQVSITTLQPRWRRTEQGYIGAWEHCLISRLWCLILARFGVWTICGRLTTCEGGRPVPGATVTAYDADWLQDDPLGSGTTGFDGRFWIYYVRDDFEKTPLSPWGISFELVGGPDIYFSAELGGTVILAEQRSKGRTPGRENSGPCLCVELCTDVIIGDPPTVPHWRQVEVFDIHPPPGSAGAQFSVEGYAGDPASGAFVFGGGVTLKGNCPLTSIATGNALEYRFTIGEWTWSTTPDDPTSLPGVAPTAMSPVTQGSAHVGYVSYTDGNKMAQSFPVNVSPGPAGWIKVEGMAVTVPMYNPPGSTTVINVSHSNFLPTFDLLVMNSLAITGAHLPKLPGGLPKAAAGRSLTPAEREPIRRYRLDFEVRDAVTPAAVPGDSLSSIVLDNSPVIWALNLEELFVNACNPLAGAATAHVLYTIDHPHLRAFSISISNNNGTVHPPPPHSGSPTVAMPSGTFGAGAFLFRGGAGGPHKATNDGGIAVNVSGDPPCAYAVNLGWQTRRWNDPATGTQILYCK